MNRQLLVSCALAAAAVATACSGGGPSTPPTSGSQPSPAATAATVAFSIVVPSAPASATSAAKRAPQFTAPSSAQSVSISLNSVNGASQTGTPTIANLSASTAGCTTGSAGLTCTVNVSAPGGSDVFTVTTFAQPNAQGTPLGAGNVSVTAQPGQTTTAPTTLSGTVAAVSLSVPQVVPEGQTATVPVVLQAKDANGNVILGTYNAPITLTLTDASGHTKISATSVADSTSASALTLAYDGGVMTSAATIAATASGVATITPATFQPDQTWPTVNGATVTFQGSVYGVDNTNATPSPIPTATFSFSETVSTNQNFNGMSGLVGVARKMLVNLNTTAFLLAPDGTDYYQWNTANGTSTLGYVGAAVAPPAGSALTVDQTTCAPPYQTVWTAPALAWTNQTTYGACTSVSKTSAWSSSFVQNADGSYSSQWSQNNVGGSTTVNSDGSAVQWDGVAGSITYIGVPAPNATSIPIWQNTPASPVPSATPTAPPAAQWSSFPNWYATAGLPNGVPPQPLMKTTMTPKGTSSLPSGCNVPASILGNNPSITELDQATSTLDPTGAYYTSAVKSYALAGVGRVCVVMNDNFWIGDVFGLSGHVWQSNDTWVQYVSASSLEAAMKALNTTSRTSGLRYAGLLLSASAHAMSEQLRMRAQLRMHAKLAQLSQSALRHR